MRVYSQQQKDEQQKQKQNCHNNKEQENQRNNLAKTLISNSKKNEKHPKTCYKRPSSSHCFKRQIKVPDSRNFIST